jgi:hypothetical protein
MMIELIVDGLERGLHIREIHHPAGARLDLALQMQLDTKRVAVQARALVARRYVGQAMRSLDSEDTKNVHMKKAPRTAP